MSKKIKLDLVAPGKWKSKAGKIVNVTKEFVANALKATKNFKYQNDEIPIVVGHPKEDAPAWGWAKKGNVLVDDRDHLQVELSEEDFHPSFLKQLKQKMYKTISAAFREDGSLKHIAFLGAQPPAVTDLDPVSFSEEENDMVLEFSEFKIKEEDNETVIEFAEYEVTPWPFTSIKRIFRNLKNYFIDELGQERADKILPEYELEGSGEKPRLIKTSNTDYFSENEISTQNLSEEQMNELEKLKAENEELKNQNSDLSTKLNEASTTLSQKEKNEKLNEAMAFCESDEVERKIPPALRSKVAHLLADIDNSKVIEFSEGETKVEVNPVDLIKDLIKMLPDSIEFSEFATKGENAEVNSDIKLGQQMADLVNK